MGTRGQRFAIIVKDGVATHVQRRRRRASSRSPRPTTFLSSSSPQHALAGSADFAAVFRYAEGERIARDSTAWLSRSARCPGSGTATFVCAPPNGGDFVPEDRSSLELRSRRRHRLPGTGARPSGRAGSRAAGAAPVSHARRGGSAASAGDEVDYATCLVSFCRGGCSRDAPPNAPLLRESGRDAGACRSRSAGIFSSVADAAPGLGCAAASRARGIHAGYIESAALRATCKAFPRAFAQRLPRLRAYAARPSMATATRQFAGGSRPAIGQRHSGFRRHDSRAPDHGACGCHVGTADRGARAARSRWPRFCKAMRRGMPLRADEVELLYDIIIARHAVTVLVHAWRTHHDAEAPGCSMAAATCRGIAAELLQWRDS